MPVKMIVNRILSRILRWKIGESSGKRLAGDSFGGIYSYQLFLPQNIRFGHDGSFYIAHMFNNQIQKYQSTCHKFIFNHSFNFKWIDY